MTQERELCAQALISLGEEHEMNQNDENNDKQIPMIISQKGSSDLNLTWKKRSLLEDSGNINDIAKVAKNPKLSIKEQQTVNYNNINLHNLNNSGPFICILHSLTNQNIGGWNVVPTALKLQSKDFNLKI